MMEEKITCSECGNEAGNVCYSCHLEWRLWFGDLEKKPIENPPIIKKDHYEVRSCPSNCGCPDGFVDITHPDGSIEKLRYVKCKNVNDLE